MRGLLAGPLLALALAACASAEVAPPGPAAAAARPASACAGPVEPPLSVVHFFDWYTPDAVNTPHWTHRVDWERYGLTPAEVGSSEAYYDLQLDLIEELGVDGIVYEYFDPRLAPFEPLSPRFLASVARHRLKVGLFYDLELEQVSEQGPVLSEEDYIVPTDELAGSLVDRFAGFYERLPREAWLVDREGRVPIMVFGFGFDRSSTDASRWHRFYETLLAGLEARLGAPPVLYWTAINRLQLEYAFQHFPERIRPFNFVLDTPHPQLAPGSVTWNVNFDNLGVQRRYGFLRVVRDDPRYLQEMLWLAKSTAPELLFVYSWNEYYEGANVMPDETYGDSRYELVKALLEDVRTGAERRLPCTLLVVDDYAELWTTGDWHLEIAEQLTLYPLRRLAPQADVVLADEASEELLESYELVLVVAQRSVEAIRAAAAALDESRVVFVGPAVAAEEDVLARFARAARRVEHNDAARLVGPGGRRLGRLLVRDDVLAARPADGVETLGRVVGESLSAPLLLRRGDDWWLNAFTIDDRVLALLFERLYGRPLEPGIMHGEGLRSQRLEIAPGGQATENTFEAPAAFEHLPLPVPWDPPPPPDLPG